jgi:Arc/MetJ-type ribon-helix-helix transcriptional regulator
MIESRKKRTPEKEDFLTLRLSRHQRKQIDQLKEETGLFKNRSHLVRTLLTEGLEVMTDRLSVD